VTPQFLLIEVFQHLGIEDRTRYAVSPAGPFPEVNQAAPIAAEREVLIVLEDDGAACRATKRAGLLWHLSRLDDARDQIVVVRLSDLAADDLPRHKFFLPAKVVDEELAVDLRRVHLRAAFPKQVSLL
jgi:hypothetical protein